MIGQVFRNYPDEAKLERCHDFTAAAQQRAQRKPTKAERNAAEAPSPRLGVDAGRGGNPNRSDR